MRWLAVSLLLLGLGCSRPASESKPAETKRYDLTGEVVEVDATGKIAKIKHEKIGEWMEAMTMEFPVKDEAEFAKLRPGQRIKASVYVQDISFWVGDIQEQSDK